MLLGFYVLFLSFLLFSFQKAKNKVRPVDQQINLVSPKRNEKRRKKVAFVILKTIFKLRNAQKKSKNLLQWWFTDPRFYKSPCFKNLAIFLQMIKTKWCISFFRQTKIFTPCSYTNVWDCFALREKCPNVEFFLVRIFLYSN